MSFGRYNNNERQVTNTTYSPIAFSNPESSICKSRLSISYFNKIMKISIALRNNENSNDSYATYDTENSKDVYVSSTKANILYNLLQEMKTNKQVHNVCIDLKNGLLLVSDGSDFKSKAPCISILSRDEAGNQLCVTYETKIKYHKGAYNFNRETEDFTDMYFDNIELDIFENALKSYVDASSYAIAATVMEASMYKRESLNNRINAIAEKVGVVNKNNNGGNSSSFLNSGGSKNNNSSKLNGEIPEEFEPSTFDNIANSLG